MQPQQPQKPKSDKIWILTGAIAYTVLSMIFAGFIIFESVDCIDFDDSRGTDQCIEEVDDKAAPYEAMFSIVQIVGIIAVITLLVKHNNSRKNIVNYQQPPQNPPQAPDETDQPK